MCLIIFALDAHPLYKLVLVANRDEFYHRPSLPAHFWEEDRNILAGKDLEKGGTWLGITKKGKFAAITNYRDPKNIRKDAPSRGELTAEYLRNNLNPLKTMFQVQHKAQQYNGFNLLLGDAEDLFYYSNYAKSIQKVGQGIHGLSNHLLNTYWHKVGLGKEKLENYLKNNATLEVEELLELLEDETQPEDEKHIQQTGLPIEYEKMLSPMFIRSSDYGTCSSSVLLWDRDNKITFAEKFFKFGKACQTQEFRFELE